MTEDMISQVLKMMKNGENPKKAMDDMIQCIQDYSDKISVAINPVHSGNLPFLLIALEGLCDNIKSNVMTNPVCWAVYAILKGGIGYENSGAVVDTGSVESILEQLKKRGGDQNGKK